MCNSNGDTPLFLACMNSNFPKHDVDCKVGHCLNQTYVYGFLDCQCTMSAQPILPLISHESVNHKNAFWRTPLHICLLTVKWELVEALVQRGADANALDNNGKSPLSYLDGIGQDIRWRNIEPILTSYSSEVLFLNNILSLVHKSLEYHEHISCIVQHFNPQRIDMQVEVCEFIGSTNTCLVDIKNVNLPSSPTMTNVHMPLLQAYTLVYVLYECGCHVTSQQPIKIEKLPPPQVTKKSLSK